MADNSDAKMEFGLDVIGGMMGPKFAAALREAATSEKFGSAITRMAIDSSFADSWGRGGIPKRERSLVVIGVLIALKQPLELKNHVKIGVANGLSVSDLEEVLIQASTYVGFPAIATATTAVIEALRDLGIAPDVRTSEERGLL